MCVLSPPSILHHHHIKPHWQTGFNQSDDTGDGEEGATLARAWARLARKPARLTVWRLHVCL